MKLRLFLYCLLMTLVSCHSEYVDVGYSVHIHSGSTPRWGHDRTEIAFIASTYAYRRAEGISAFPDGGQSKYIYEDVGIYILNVKEREIKKIISLNELIQLLGVGDNRWDIKILFDKNTISYCLFCGDSRGQWRRYEKKIKSFKLGKLKAKYDKAYKVDIITKEVDVINQGNFLSLFAKNSKDNNISYPIFKKMISKISFKNRGVSLERVCPRSKEKYIEYIINQKGGRVMREIISQQVIPMMSESEVQIMFQKMSAHAETLDGHHKMFYEQYSREFKNTITKRLKEF